ncbi:uncharacterized protein [Primulina eburnea]|uniref:uncharacterized protein n=1 Tax=Primulina eburnea TaxID=1245227 RepID=UPI003C6CBABD
MFTLCQLASYICVLNSNVKHYEIVEKVVWLLEIGFFLRYRYIVFSLYPYHSICAIYKLLIINLIEIEQWDQGGLPDQDGDRGLGDLDHGDRGLGDLAGDLDHGDRAGVLVLEDHAGDSSVDALMEFATSLLHAYPVSAVVGC